MKTGFYFLMVMLFCVITTISCNKGPDAPPTPMQADSLASALPIQIMHIYLNISSVYITDVISVKYDTTSHHIDLYQDDTTNTNPYDVLEASYTYNSGGYLISYTQSHGYEGSVYARFGYSYIINRTADNKIISIVAQSEDHTETDSIFYNYQTVSGGTKITVFSRDHNTNGTFQFSDPVIYNYDTDFKLTQNSFSSGMFSYTYNPNKSISKVVILENNDTENGSYTYASGIPDGKEDVFRKALLGKDYYLPDLQNLDPFYTSVGIDFELNNVLSITDPYHVTGAHYEYPDNGATISDDGIWIYELNDKKNVSKLIFVIDGGPPETFRLKYD